MLLEKVIVYCDNLPMVRVFVSKLFELVIGYHAYCLQLFCVQHGLSH